MTYELNIKIEVTENDNVVITDANNIKHTFLGYSVEDAIKKYFTLAIK